MFSINKIKSIILLLFTSLSLFSCHNILSYEQIESCIGTSQLEFVRSHNNLIGLVRHDVENDRYFIQARLTGQDNFTLLDVCNLPISYREADKEIRFFGNEFAQVSQDEPIIPFEITFIETFSRR